MPEFQLAAGAIEASYDAVAGSYAEQFFDELSRKPFDRDVLDAFVAACPPAGRVLDVGCGPGQVAAYLVDHGVEASGVDLSPAMIETARRLTPGVDFTVGDMRRLAWTDGALAGVTAFYSLIHIERHQVPEVLREFARVLAPGGRLLLAVHGGSGNVQRDEFLGHAVPFAATLFTLGEIASLVEDAGFWVDAAHQREPYSFEHPTPRIYVAAHAVPSEAPQPEAR